MNTPVESCSLTELSFFTALISDCSSTHSNEQGKGVEKKSLRGDGKIPWSNLEKIRTEVGGWLAGFSPCDSRSTAQTSSHSHSAAEKKGVIVSQTNSRSKSEAVLDHDPPHSLELNERIEKRIRRPVQCNPTKRPPNGLRNSGEGQGIFQRQAAYQDDATARP